jgi:hypothetical protein
MANIQERIDNIKQCAEERSQLQLACLENIDFSALTSPTDLAKAHHRFEICLKDNAKNYPCLAKREAYLNYENI